MCFQFTHFPCDDWENIYTLSYYHHEIGSMNYYPLFRVRSWNNDMRCMSSFVLVSVNAYVCVRLCLQAYVHISIKCMHQPVCIYLCRCASTWIHIAGTSAWVSSLLSSVNLFVYTICICVFDVCICVRACIFASCLVININIIICMYYLSRVLCLRTGYPSHIDLVFEIVYNSSVWHFTIVWISIHLATFSITKQYVKGNPH